MEEDGGKLSDSDAQKVTKLFRRLRAPSVSPRASLAPAATGSQEQGVQAAGKPTTSATSAAAAPGSSQGSIDGAPSLKNRWIKGVKRLQLMNRATAAFDNRFIKPPDEFEDEFIPEACRRFLFDDVAIKRGDMKDLFIAEEPPEEDFNDVVDQDDRRVVVFVSQELVGNMIESTYFRTFIFGLIAINAVLIAMQTNEQLTIDYTYYFSIFDQAVMATFVCELLLKWYYGFYIFWKVSWNILDFIIIVALLLGPQLAFLSSSRILRILRVFRAFRSLRSISALAGLSMVVQTILQSVPDMAYILLLLTIILLVLGVMGVTMFGKFFPTKFGNLDSAMFSLFICVTQDGWVEIFEDFKNAGGGLYIGGAAYFFVSIMLGAFVFANLFVAVVVTNLELAMRELKAEKRAEVDTFASSASPDPDDLFVVAEHNETVPLVSNEEAHKGIDITTQMPLHLSDLKGLTPEKLQKYFMALIALEENLAEYLNIKDDLLEMYGMIFELNKIDEEEEEMLIENNNNGVRPSVSRIDLSALKKGDILSNLMKLEEKRDVSSSGKHTMKDVIKSVADPEGEGLVRRPSFMVKRRRSKLAMDQRAGSDDVPPSTSREETSGTPSREQQSAEASSSGHQPQSLLHPSTQEDNAQQQPRPTAGRRLSKFLKLPNR